MPALLDRAIRYHARRGIRWWCDCSFCTAKIQGTWRIGHFRRISWHATSYSNDYHPRTSTLAPVPPPYLDTNDFEWRRGNAWAREEYYRRLVADTREYEREKLREELKYLQKQVI